MNIVEAYRALEAGREVVVTATNVALGLRAGMPVFLPEGYVVVADYWAMQDDAFTEVKPKVKVKQWQWRYWDEKGICYQTLFHLSETDALTCGRCLSRNLDTEIEVEE